MHSLATSKFKFVSEQEMPQMKPRAGMTNLVSEGVPESKKKDHGCQ
jgi:hypothetical protein